jgi:hypothetical protein
MQGFSQFINLNDKFTNSFSQCLKKYAELISQNNSFIQEKRPE